MRITNQMMINSSLSNIQVNKNQLNTLSEQLSTQKKINKPSDDPVVAIRALRLRTSLDQVTQYLEKNIPDASSWLSVTEDALDEGYEIVSDLYKYCVQGSTDSYSESERSTIADSLESLKEAFYSEGDVDYAGRYVFTGYYTDTPLTYQSDDTAADEDYTITQNFTRDDLTEKTVYTNSYSSDDIINLDVKYDTTTGQPITPDVATVHRLQLAYSEVDAAGFTITDANGNSQKVTVDSSTDPATVSYVDADGNPTSSALTVTASDGSTATITVTETTDTNYVPGDTEIAFNPTTGELYLGEDVYKEVYENNSFSFTYDKNNFVKGDVNPVMYFDCINNTTGIEYNKVEQDIEYNVNFSQKLKVNTEASEAFNIYLGRTVDDLKTAVQNVNDLSTQIAQVESMKEEAKYSDDESQQKLSDMLDGLNKQYELAKNEMTKVFEDGITYMQNYQTQITNAKADCGNRESRLELTESRLTEQQTNFTNLKSSNEDIDLEEVVINYSSCENVYTASLTSASKVVKQSLLDFL